MGKLNEKQTDYRKRVFVGISKRKGNQPPRLEEAIEDGYEQAAAYYKRLRSYKPPLTLRVVDIYASGTNPFSEYKVVLSAET